MPVSRKRAAPTDDSQRSSPSKRTRASNNAPAKSRSTTTRAAKATIPASDDDVFTDNRKSKEKEDGVIDLIDTDEVPESQRMTKEQIAAREAKKARLVRISQLQCAICMDNATAQTVTHCGHIFCSECLFSAMNVDVTRNKCPICRAKIECKEQSAYTCRTKGIWNLQFKKRSPVK